MNASATRVTASKGGSEKNRQTMVNSVSKRLRKMSVVKRCNHCVSDPVTTSASESEEGSGSTILSIDTPLNTALSKGIKAKSSARSTNLSKSLVLKLKTSQRSLRLQRIASKNISEKNKDEIKQCSIIVQEEEISSGRSETTTTSTKEVNNLRVYTEYNSDESSPCQGRKPEPLTEREIDQSENWSHKPSEVTASLNKESISVKNMNADSGRGGRLLEKLSFSQNKTLVSAAEYATLTSIVVLALCIDIVRMGLV